MIKYVSCILFLISNLISAQGYICAVGGGGENYNDWSDAPYSWIVQKSDSGKILILSYYDESDWIPNYFLSLGASQAVNKKINSFDIANSQEIFNELITSDAIFIKGGDQWNYVNTWKNTKTEDAIRYVYEHGGVIAGTSAGAMVLSEVVFTAQNGSGDLSTYLINPFTTFVQLDNDFLNLVPNVLFDTHFIERGRFARLIPMMFNYHYQSNSDFIGIGIDDRTAFCIDENGIGEVMGSGAVSIFQKDDETIFNNQNNNNYLIENLKCDQLTKDWKFDLNTKSIFYVPPSAKTVDTSRSYNYPKTNLWLTGSNQIEQQISYNLTEFLNFENSQSILVLSNQGYLNQTNLVTNYLSANGYNYNSAFIDQSSLESNEVKELIINATCFLILGDSLNILAQLNDTSKVCGSAFLGKIINHTPCFFFGNSGKLTGQNYIYNTDEEPYAAYYGELTNNIGFNIFGELIFQPLLLQNSSYYENRTCALLYGLMRNRNCLGIFTDRTNRIFINYLSKSIKLNGTIPSILVDASNTTFVDSSTYTSNSGSGYRQVVAMNNLRYSLSSKNGIEYSLITKKFNFTSDISSKKISHKSFFLFNNYPNPFNPVTTISFEIPLPGFVSLKVYNILGKEINTLINEDLNKGFYKVNFNAQNLASGVYFYQLKYDDIVQTKSMLVLK